MVKIVLTPFVVGWREIGAIIESRHCQVRKVRVFLSFCAPEDEVGGAKLVLCRPSTERLSNGRDTDLRLFGQARIEQLGELIICNRQQGIKGHK